MKQILVVCTGNTCRSPMVAGLMQARLFDEGLDNLINIESAGTHAASGRPANKHSFQLLINRGIFIGFHKAHQLNNTDVDLADIIIVFEEAHRRYIFDMAPDQLSKVFLLSELAYASGETADPFGQPVDAYVAALQEIDSYINEGWENLLGQLGMALTNEPKYRSYKDETQDATGSRPQIKHPRDKQWFPN